MNFERSVTSASCGDSESKATSMTFQFKSSQGYLVCPRTRAELVEDGDSLVSTSPAARLRYPVVDDIPRLLVDEATELSVTDWQQIMERSGRSRETGLPL